MALTDKEKADIAAQALQVAEDIVAMFGKDSDGGRKVTKREWKRLGKRLARLGIKILVDVFD